MLAPLLLIWPMSVALTWLVAQGIAHRPYDRELGELARALAQEVTVEYTSGRAPQGAAMVRRLERTVAQLVRADVAIELVFTARVFDGREAAVLGLATRLSDTPYDDAMVLAGEIAGRSPSAVRGAKALINGLVNQGAADQFAEERRIIGSLIGRPDQVEAVMSNFEKRPAAFADPA